MTVTTTHIRTLLLHPKPIYAIGEAATLLEMDWRELRGWMETGEVEGIETDEGLVLPWAELVSFAMDFWSQEVVEEALGAELALTQALSAREACINCASSIGTYTISLLSLCHSFSSSPGSREKPRRDAMWRVKVSHRTAVKPFACSSKRSTVWPCR
jgi:hypothetical protein